jgi:hypothetical protein
VDIKTIKEKLMTTRHHHAHPPTKVKPSPNNKHPEAYTPPEQSAVSPAVKALARQGEKTISILS